MCVCVCVCAFMCVQRKRDCERDGDDRRNNDKVFGSRFSFALR